MFDAGSVTSVRLRNLYRDDPPRIGTQAVETVRLTTVS
jgi:hypothetical protein